MTTRETKAADERERESILQAMGRDYLRKGAHALTALEGYLKLTDGDSTGGFKARMLRTATRGRQHLNSGRDLLLFKGYEIPSHAPNCAWCGRYAMTCFCEDGFDGEHFCGSCAMD